ncbi:DUF5009 domain-containing protein [Thalassotalea sp. LPB0316]|nr:DUF5009 domain-containing protein [Thalassotalea sp. LPB0316]
MQERDTNVKGSFETKQRINSIDALRGFDMIWILGLQGIFAGLFTLTSWPLFSVLSTQMEHSQWHGVTAYDVIFPLFIFLSGMSIGLSAKPLNSYPKAKRQQLINKAIKRLIVLCLLGVIYNHGWGQGIPMNLDEVRFASVLARIGIAGFVATLVVWYCRPSYQYYVLFGLLLGYLLLLALANIGQYGAGDYSAEGALNVWFDQVLLPGATYRGALVDPEGILSNLGSITNALAGVFIGRFFINRYRANQPYLQSLIAMGLFALVLGYGLSFIQPINKTLWTTPFALVTIGYSCLLFVLFHLMFDFDKWQKLSLSLRVIGMNAIVVYLASALVDWQYVSQSLFGGVIGASAPSSQALLSVIALVAVQWWGLYFLYKRNIFIKL